MMQVSLLHNKTSLQQAAHSTVSRWRHHCNMMQISM